MAGHLCCFATASQNLRGKERETAKIEDRSLSLSYERTPPERSAGDKFFPSCEESGEVFGEKFHADFSREELTEKFTLPQKESGKRVWQTVMKKVTEASEKKK